MAMVSTSIVRVPSCRKEAAAGDLLQGADLRQELVMEKKGFSSSSFSSTEYYSWYAWLSRTPLDAAVAHEYALLFSRNELVVEDGDALHFDHAFLLSMGVSVAKHRLEILKLAAAGDERRRRTRRRRMPPLLQLGRPPRPVARLLAAADRTRRCLARCVRSLSAGVGGGGGGCGEGSGALVPARVRGCWNPDVGRGGGGRWDGGEPAAALKQGMLLLTDGNAGSTAGMWWRRWGRSKDKVRDDSGAGEAGGARWDSMFQDLKPT